MKLLVGVLDTLKPCISYWRGIENQGNRMFTKVFDKWPEHVDKILQKTCWQLFRNMFWTNNHFALTFCWIWDPNMIPKPSPGRSTCDKNGVWGSDRLGPRRGPGTLQDRFLGANRSHYWRIFGLCCWFVLCRFVLFVVSEIKEWKHADGELGLDP